MAVDKSTLKILSDRIAKKTVRSESGCHLWMGAERSNGYGQIKIGGKTYSPHRIAYLAAKGEIGSGKMVCHTCDVRNCVNPEHLWLGDGKANTADMWQKGRWRGPKSGSANRFAKLTEEQVRAIRGSGLSQVALAREYGVSRSTIGDILRRKMWRHVL